MRNTAVHITLLFAWAMLFHPLAHAFDGHDAHLSSPTAGQTCEFCHSNSVIEPAIALVVSIAVDFEVASEPLVSAPQGYKLRPCGRAPPSFC